jgi:hypothetical protein
MRETNFMTRGGIQLTILIKVLSGRGNSEKFREITLINIYAPSGTAMRLERDHFYNSDLA